MDGLPVTVRLLDPPLHEFLPSTEELAVKEAAEGLSDEERALLAAARSWREVNPMLGTRGVRLGVVRPGLYEMQVRALMEAAVERLDARWPADRRGHDPAHGLARRARARPRVGGARDRTRPSPRRCAAG